MCKLEGILARWGGRCWRSKTFWPPKSGSDGCPRLGPQGCTFSAEDKPVTCHLFPLRLNKSGTLVVHHKSMMSPSFCGGNSGIGPMIVDVLRESLVELFGQGQYDRVRADVVTGRDSYFVVPEQVLRAYEDESKKEENNEPPSPRSIFLPSVPQDML